MGPGDVSDRLPPGSDPKNRDWSTAPSNQEMIAPDAMELFDCSVTGKFGFNNGRLTTISLFFGHQSDDESKVLVAYTRFISQAVSEFTKRAGKPHVVVRGDSLIQTWVNSPSLWCELNTNRDPRQPYAYLVLADPATKPRGVPKSTADGTQPKQTWLNKGWLGFKFGMGCADVRRLAELPSGDLKAKRPPWLLEDQDDPRKSFLLFWSLTPTPSTLLARCPR